MTTAKYSVSIPSVSVALVANIADSTAISTGDFEFGMVFIPTGSSITTLTWHTSTTLSGTYLAANNASGAITQTVSDGKAYPIPADLAGARFLKITGNAAGIVGVTLKD